MALQSDRIPDPHEIAMLALELSENDEHEIDLHGETVDLALSRLDSFLHQELMAGSEAIGIIHGKGEDKLRRAIWKWLEEQKDKELVAAYRGASVSLSRQLGATYVALHRMR